MDGVGTAVRVRSASAILPRVGIMTNGRPVTIRRLRSSDAAGVRALLERCSPESLHKRFLSPIPRVPEGLVRRLVEVDHFTLEALVAVVRGTIVGIGHIGNVRANESAEIAVLVEDAYQRSGVGTLLARRMIAVARHRGVASISGVIDRENAPALAALRSFLPGADLRMEGPLVMFEAEVPPPQPYPATLPWHPMLGRGLAET